MAVPRALRLVRDRAQVAETLASSAPEASPLVREAATLEQFILGQLAVQLPTNYALQVPAYARSLQLYMNTIASFPLIERVKGEQVVARPFLRNPAPNTTYFGHMTRTVADLVQYDQAFWIVLERDWAGYPKSCIHAPYTETSQWQTKGTWTGDPIDPAIDNFIWNGSQYPMRDVIRFDGNGTGGWLSAGRTAIMTAAALEEAVKRYAEVPMPQTVIKNTGADLPAEQVDALLEAWETARATRSTAYLNSVLDYESAGFNPNDLQLTDARNTAAANIARLCNLDPVWVGASMPGGSLVYSNRTDLYRQLLDLSLTPVMAAITQRLSESDVTPGGHSVDFDTTEFLRSNTVDLVGVIERLLPLGVIDITEARALLDMPANQEDPNL